MFERKAVMTVAAAAAIIIFAHGASAQSDRFDRGSGSSDAERGREGAVPITDRDRTDAERALYRWDANRDGCIDRDEAQRGHWSSDPFQFDANGDGRLTAAELAVRYARRQMDRQDSPSGSKTGTPPSTPRYESSTRRDHDRPTGRDSHRSDSQTNSEPANVYACRSRAAYERLFGDLPAWFKEKDADLDGQVMMSEYASEWTDQLAEEFAQLDPNGDGVITAKECPPARAAARIAASVPAREEASDSAPSSPPTSSLAASDQVAENSTLSPEEAKIVARDSRRQLWGKLYSSRPAGQP